MEPYTIVIPPPNITGMLTMGHILNNTIQDVYIRYKRMRGFNALWVPGTDHASIATEAKVVRWLREEMGKKKADVKNCIPTTMGSIGTKLGLRRRSSLRNPANMAAHDKSRLKTPSNMGWTDGEKGKFNSGLTKKKLRDKFKTSSHVRCSSWSALAPGKIPSDKKTMYM